MRILCFVNPINPLTANADISVPLRTDKIIKNCLNVLKVEKIIKIYIQVILFVRNGVRNLEFMQVKKPTWSLAL